MPNHLMLIEVHLELPKTLRNAEAKHQWGGKTSQKPEGSSLENAMVAMERQHIA